MPIDQSHSLARSEELGPAESGASQQPSAWREQMRTAIRTPAELLSFLALPAESGPEVNFPMLVPRAYAQRMRPGDRADPLLRQVLPDVDENRRLADFQADPVGDLNSRRAPGLLHKYAGRALLICTGACAVHCRYCFRQEFPYAKERAAGRRWQEALDYLKEQTEVEEVILSGGDPLMLPTRQLESLTEALTELKHIRRLRIHTRLPLVLPDRVTPRLLHWLQELPWPKVMVIHANHPAEFDDQVDQALAALRQRGVHLLNQAVLLAGVNDDEETLLALMTRSFSAGALPYYLHQLDRVRGAQRFEVDQARASALIEALRRRLPGYLVPKLVREEPGMPYKTPLL
ncbi:MAG: EF-P beta-lysylation protein EpmB [Wenzhouxiangella sp.]